MMNIANYLFKRVIFFLSFIQFAYGQATLPNVIPPSPESTSLGKFADMPVGLYTGIPQIDIPIYNIQVAGKSIPISLSYHASGIKVAEIPSSVGSGWALNSGGVIMRTVRGKVDEIDGYLISPAIPEAPNCLTQEAARDYLWETTGLNHYDTEPDMFYFNFNGYTGKFVIDKKRVIHQIPYSNLKIEPSNTSLGSWKITTPDGTEYDFNTVESVDSKSSWYLSLIKYPESNQSVIFEYERDHLLYDLPVSETLYQFANAPGGFRCVQDVLNIQKQYSYVGMNAARISKITFPNGKIEFIPGNYRKDYKGARTLSEINVSNNEGLLKSFKLSYNYFDRIKSVEDDGSADANTTANTAQRLSLKSIQEFGSDNLAKKQPYTFKYYDNTSLPDRLNSKALDHWGYYNGANGNTTLIPSHENYNGRFTGGIREANEEYAKAGTLTEITYPTGATTKFDYEINKANTNSLGGGTPRLVGSDYRVGNCNISSFASFTVQDDVSGSVNFTATLKTLNSSDSYTITRKICQGNSTGSIPTSVANYIYFEIIDITDPSSPQVVYNSNRNDQGMAIGEIIIPTTDKVTLRNGIYKIKAIKGNSDFSINAPEITSLDANFTTPFVFDLSGTAYSNQNTAPNTSLVGGLRIKQITDADPVSQKSSVRNYDYTDNGISTGVINWVPVYVFNYSEIISNCGENDYKVYTSTSSRPLTEMQGGNVGYSKVTVSYTDPNNQSGSNGKSEFFYSNPTDLSWRVNNIDTYTLSSAKICFSNQWIGGDNYYRFPFAPSLSPDCSRGLLTQQIDYIGNIDGTYKKIKETINKYKDNYLGSYDTLNEVQDVKAMKIGISVRRDVSNSTTNEQGPFHTYAFQYYYIPSRYSKLIETDETLFDSSNPITTAKYFAFDSYANLQPTSTTFTDSRKNSIKNVYKYPNDFPAESIYASMTSKNMISPIIEQTTYKNDVFLNQQTTNYGQWNNIIAPASLQSKVLDNPVDIRLQYNSYDDYGNILDMSKTNGSHSAYQWAYNNSYPITEVKNAKPEELYFENFEENSSATTGNAHTGTKYLNASSFQVNRPIPNSRKYVISYWFRSGGKWVYSGVKAYTGSYTLSDGDAYDDIRILPLDAAMTNYTFKPLVGMTSATDAKGQSVFYEYDNLQRLRNTRDQNGYIIKNYEYNYADPGSGTQVPHTYSSAVTSRTFTRNNCAAGGVPGSYTYTIPEGAYTSTISQDDADAKAISQVSANGQNMANNNAGCTFSNAVLTQTFTKDNCASGSIAGTYTYTIPAGTYTSTISQDVAQSLAQNIMNVNGQAIANEHASCTFRNDPMNQVFKSNLCVGAEVPSDYNYVIPEGKYTSTLSLNDANAQARADLAANGQAMANSNGSCNCTGEMNKRIGGYCQTGTRVTTNSEYNSRGRYYVCTYHYEWSDGSRGEDLTEQNSNPCPVN